MKKSEYSDWDKEKLIKEIEKLKNNNSDFGLKHRKKPEDIVIVCKKNYQY